MPILARSLLCQEVMRCLDDRYQILDLLGCGGMGMVHRALDIRTGQVVALKRLLLEFSAEALERRCFEREFEILKTLDLPGVPRAYEMGEHLGQPYFTMEVVPGRALPEWLEESVRSWPERARLVAHAALRLASVHDAGIVHGDVKPSNLLVDGDGDPWWIDFGISSPVESETFPEELEFILGTLAYLPPERVALVPELRRRRSDVYSLGVILFAVLSGRLPFQGEDETTLIEKIEFSPPPALHEVAADALPAELSRVVARAMEKDPERRQSGAREFAEEVLAAVGPGPGDRKGLRRAAAAA